MNDLFNFLKNLVRGEPEVIAAFFMGFIVAAVFLSYLIYWIFDKLHSKKTDLLETDMKRLREQLGAAQQEQVELKKKSKDRKERGEAKEQEAAESAGKLEQAKIALLSLKKTMQRLESDDAVLRDQLKIAVGKNKRLYANAQEKLKSYVDQTTALKKQVTTLNEQAKLFEKLQGQLWEVPVDKAKITAFRPLKKNSAVIIAITNLKGGVGKTTLTANIAITYCCRMNRRVLAIDLDFQASLTNLCLPPELVGELQIGHGRLVDNVFKELSPELAKSAYANIVQTRVPKLHLLAASGSFANVEEQAKARWLMNFETSDLRCVLRAALHDPLIQDNFDVILIDCPPRWTTSSINAIACCDYVLVPTQLDRVSSEAVPRLLAWLRDLRASSTELYGHFDVLGVVGNRAYPREGLVAQERTIWDELPDKCKKAWIAPVYSFGTIIKDKSEFRRAANNREFAALHPELQPSFVSLVQEIETRRSEHESR